MTPGKPWTLADSIADVKRVSELPAVTSLPGPDESGDVAYIVEDSHGVTVGIFTDTDALLRKVTDVQAATRLHLPPAVTMFRVNDAGDTGTAVDIEDIPGYPGQETED